MFTYQENRVLHIKSRRLTFPCEVTAIVDLNPSSLHGDSVPGAWAPVGAEIRSTWNANTGRSLIESSDPPFAPTTVDIVVGGLRVVVQGTHLRARWRCSSRSELIGTLGALHSVLPLALSAQFADAATTARTHGHAGDVAFVWQVQQTASAFQTTTNEERNARTQRALELVPLLCDKQNIRLLAASAYLQRAIRLLAAGVGPSEFAGEAVINLAKSLEALFPAAPNRTRDAVRGALSGLGYDDNQIERTFVRALILRSSLDAAHVRLAVLTTNQRRKLQIYMEGVVTEFRDLVLLVAGLVRRHEFVLAGYERDRAAADLVKMLDAIPDRW